MTEREFLQEIWRPYDTVTIVNGIKGRVHSVSFKTRSVRIMMPQGAPEWFACDMITTHKSATCGDPNDLAMIEDLNNKLMDAEKRIEKLQTENTKMKQKLGARNMEAIGKNLNEILANMALKKKRIEKLENCISEIENILEVMQNEYNNEGEGNDLD